MNKEIDELRSAIRDKLLNLKENNFVYSQNSINLSLSLLDIDYKELMKVSDQKKIQHSLLNDLIKEERDSLQVKLQPKLTTSYKLIPAELPLGQHLKIYTSDEHGEAIEELINVGPNLFILIGHERGSLRVGDVVFSTTSPWNEGGVIDFQVYRDFKRYTFDENHTLYRTRRIKHIQLIDPQLDYDKLYSKLTNTKLKKDEG